MSISLDAGVVAVAGIDRVHRLALPRGGVELAIGRGSGAHAPDPRHRQRALRGDHVGQRLVDRRAFDMPACETGQLPVIMGVGRLGHLAQAQVQSLGEQDVEQADPVAARYAGAQMGEGVGELQRGVHFEQQVGDADGRQATVKVQHQVIDPVRRIGGQAIDAQRPVLDAAFRDRTVARGATEPGEAIGETGLAVREPDMRIGRYGQLRSMRDFHRYEDVAKVTVPVRAVEPDVTRAQRVAQMEHDRDFSEARIIVALRPQLTPPFGMWAQEIVGRRERVFGGDGDHRVQQGSRDRRGLEMEAAQHTRGIATEAVIPLIDMRQRIIAKRVRQNPGRRDEAGEMVPSRRTRDRILQRRAVAMRFDERLAERGEAVQRRCDPASRFRGTCVMQLFCLAPGAPDDPVMRLDHRIRSRGGPLDDADSEDGATPVGAEITQAIGEVTFALSAQPGDAMRRDVAEQAGIEVHRTQELKPVEQSVCRGGIVARLDPAQPDEAADCPRQHFGRQPVEPGAGDKIKARCDALLDAAFGRDERIRAQALDRRDRRQDGHGIAAAGDEAPGEIVVRVCLLGFGEQPVTERPCRRALTGKRPVSVDGAQHLHMLLAGLVPDGVADEHVTGDAELGAEEGGYRERDHLARHQHSSRIAQRAQLQREADPVFRSASPVDVDQVVVRQDVMP